MESICCSTRTTTRTTARTTIMSIITRTTTISIITRTITRTTTTGYDRLTLCSLNITIVRNGGSPLTVCEVNLCNRWWRL